MTDQEIQYNIDIAVERMSKEFDKNPILTRTEFGNMINNSIIIGIMIQKGYKVEYMQ